MFWDVSVSVYPTEDETGRDSARHKDGDFSGRVAWDDAGETAPSELARRAVYDWQICAAVERVNVNGVPRRYSLHILIIWYDTSKTSFGGDKRASERLIPARAELRGSASNCSSRHPTNWSISVPNLGAIVPAVLEIWNRHPARAHVQGTVLQ